MLASISPLITARYIMWCGMQWSAIWNLYYELSEKMPKLMGSVNYIFMPFQLTYSLENRTINFYTITSSVWSQLGYRGSGSSRLEPLFKAAVSSKEGSEERFAKKFQIRTFFYRTFSQQELNFKVWNHSKPCGFQALVSNGIQNLDFLV